MNKILFYCCFFFLSLGFGQNFNAGFLGGINTSQVSGDNLSGFNKIGIKLGAFVSRDLNLFSTQLAFQYVNKGSRAMTDDETHQEKYKLQLNYIQIPITFKKSIYKNSVIEIGTSIGYLLNSNEKNFGYEVDGVDFNKIEYNLHIGVNYIINKNLFLNTRIENSLNPIRAHASRKTYRWNKGQYNTSLSFILYYVFRQ